MSFYGYVPAGLYDPVGHYCLNTKTNFTLHIWLQIPSSIHGISSLPDVGVTTSCRFHTNSHHFIFQTLWFCLLFWNKVAEVSFYCVTRLSSFISNFWRASDKMEERATNGDGLALSVSQCMEAVRNQSSGTRGECGVPHIQTSHHQFCLEMLSLTA